MDFSLSNIEKIGLIGKINRATYNKSTHTYDP